MLDKPKGTSGGKKSRRDGLFKPKGRQVEESALEDVRTLLGDRSRQRDLLIEHLHLLQDTYGALHARHLRALAEEMRLAQAEVYEVATFYHHFDVVKEGEAAPAPLTVRVCDSVSCMMAGADDLITSLEQTLDPAAVRIVRAPCQGRCGEAPSVCVGRREVGFATTDTITDLISAGQTTPPRHSYRALDDYLAENGYSLLKACLAGERTADELISTLSDAGLRGLGGAGFPAGRKWSIVRGFEGPKLMTVNGDEGEPGTFKDRTFLETDPHRMIEGALIAAWAVGAERCYIYMRDEYPAVLQILADEMAAVTAAGLADHCPLELRRGAGAYICGEESAMLESIEGKRGLPRHKPPYIAEVGLFARPTLNHNVETLYWIRDIVENGGEWFASKGKTDADGVHHKGFRSFSVSGRVQEPGVKILPCGVSINEIIDACGGMAEGHVFKAFLPGGASGGIFPAHMADLPMDFGTFEKHGGFIGSHAVVILSEQDSVKDVALNLMRFFKHESCGQCTPCRAGTEKMVGLLEQADADQEAIGDLISVMREASICGLGQAAGNPVAHLLERFPQDL